MYNYRMILFTKNNRITYRFKQYSEMMQAFQEMQHDQFEEAIFQEITDSSFHTIERRNAPYAQFDLNFGAV